MREPPDLWGSDGMRATRTIVGCAFSHHASSEGVGAARRRSERPSGSVMRARHALDRTPIPGQRWRERATGAPGKPGTLADFPMTGPSRGSEPSGSPVTTVAVVSATIGDGAWAKVTGPHVAWPVIARIVPAVVGSAWVITRPRAAQVAITSFLIPPSSGCRPRGSRSGIYHSSRRDARRGRFFSAAGLFPSLVIAWRETCDARNLQRAVSKCATGSGQAAAVRRSATLARIRDPQAEARRTSARLDGVAAVRDLGKGGCVAEPWLRSRAGPGGGLQVPSPRS
jgi:hypothetical protein